MKDRELKEYVIDVIDGKGIVRYTIVADRYESSTHSCYVFSIDGEKIASFPVSRTIILGWKPYQPDGKNN